MLKKNKQIRYIKSCSSQIEQEIVSINTLQIQPSKFKFNPQIEQEIVSINTLQIQPSKYLRQTVVF